jgi:methylthioribose-1-phosphate isomerase
MEMVWLSMNDVEDPAEAAVAAPLSTIGFDTPDRSSIPIELRSESEALEMNAARVAPEGTRAYDPAFDVASANLVSAIAAEAGVVRPDELHTLGSTSP